MFDLRDLPTRALVSAHCALQTWVMESERARLHIVGSGDRGAAAALVRSMDEVGDVMAVIRSVVVSRSTDGRDGLRTLDEIKESVKRIKGEVPTS